MTTATNLPGDYLVVAHATQREALLGSQRKGSLTLLVGLGIDVTIIQASLDHARPLTTRGNLHAELTMRLNALARLAEHLT